MKKSTCGVCILFFALNAFGGALDGPNGGLQSGHVQGVDDITPGEHYRITGIVLQVLDDGILVECHLLHTSGDKKAKGTVLLKGYKAAVHEGDKINAMGVPVGNYQYIDVMGSQRTVASYELAN